MKREREYIGHRTSPKAGLPVAKPLKRCVVESPNRRVWSEGEVRSVERQRCYAELPELPGSGYKTFFVTPLKGKRRTLTRSLVGRANGMENEFLSVVIQPNGALAVTDKQTGRSWTDLGYFRDRSEIGNPWEHAGVPFEESLNTLGEKARIARVLAGDLVTTYQVELDWELPRGRSASSVRSSGKP